MKDRATNEYQLPDGQWIRQHNVYETDFVYDEIFNQHTYIQHGIRIPENAIVFDVGANIGLFTLYVMKFYPTSNVFSFEPSPEIYKLLKQNTADFGNQVLVSQFGLSNKNEEKLFHYYPEYSVISGFHVNRQRDAAIIMSGAQSIDVEENKRMRTLINHRLEVMKDILCQLTTISTVIHQAQLPQIDLLKIDAEGSELAILQGIKEEDWLKIKQIVMEVHSQSDLDAILMILKNKFSTIYYEEIKQFADLGLFNVFASVGT